MKAIDLFGVFGRPTLGQVKDCPLFRGTTTTPAAAPALAPAPAPAPAPASAPTLVPTPVEASPITQKGVLLNANIQNEAGETPRPIILSEGQDPIYLIATALGIRADAPASAFDVAGLKNISIPMMMTAEDPAIIQSTLAAPRPGFSKKIWFFKIDHSPMTFSVSPDQMRDVDGTPLSGVAFMFPMAGSFYITPAGVILRDGDDLAMNFTVKVASDLGRRGYPVRNIGRSK